MTSKKPLQQVGGQWIYWVSEVANRIYLLEGDGSGRFVPFILIFSASQRLL